VELEKDFDTKMASGAFLPEYFPLIVCIGGSTKFKDEIIETQKYLTSIGRIVLGIFLFKDDKVVLTEDQIHNLFDLQLKLIELCDVFLVVNPGGYVGDSTKKEIEYALKLHKIVRYTSV
jgi:hypothetical protein